jgi:hypothetical protein
MIYFITIHHETGKFFNLQAKYIRTFTTKEYKIYCGMSGITTVDAQQHNIEFHNIINLTDVKNQHWFRMNYLFNALQQHESLQPDDLVIFIDGDAFPIDSWEQKISSYLQAYPIAAIQRRENPEPLLREEQKRYPHPCFFATTVKFWVENKLEWRLDPFQGAHTAGVLIKMWLDEQKLESRPLLRTNAFNIHPLYFGIYDDIIYHHGAGNRIVYDSVDIWTRKGLNPGVDLDLRYPIIPEFNKKLSDLVYNQILEDDKYIKIFFGGRE